METLVALAILGVIAVTFLNGINTAMRATSTADEQTTAESLAQSQMEWVKRVTYIEDASQYSPAAIPSGDDYLNYSVAIIAEPLHDPGPSILDEQVGGLDQVAENAPILLRFEVQCQRILVAVGLEPGGLFVVCKIIGPTTSEDPQSARVLNDDHLGTEVGQDSRAMGSRPGVRQVDDSDSLQR